MDVEFNSSVSELFLSRSYHKFMNIMCQVILEHRLPWRIVPIINLKWPQGIL